MSLEKEDETDPEALEEAGILEADVGAHFFTLYPVHGKEDRRNLVLRHFHHYVPNFVGIACGGTQRHALPRYQNTPFPTLPNTGSIAAMAELNAALMPRHSDQQLAGIDPKLKINMDPQAHRELRPEMMVIREELRQAKQQTLAVRRTALKKLLMKDFLQEDSELRALGLCYAPPDP